MAKDYHEYNDSISTPQRSARDEAQTPVSQAFTLGLLMFWVVIIGGIVGMIAVGMSFERTPTVLSVALVAFVLPLLVVGFGLARRIIVYALEPIVQKDLDHDGVIGVPVHPGQPRREIQLIPHYADDARPLYRAAGGEFAFEPEDLFWLVGQLNYEAQDGWQVRNLRGVTMPSGAECTDEIYAEYIKLLEANGWLRGRTERTKGRLVASKDEILRALNLA